jgi:hypothetical protein
MFSAIVASLGIGCGEEFGILHEVSSNAISIKFRSIPVVAWVSVHPW